MPYNVCLMKYLTPLCSRFVFIPVFILALTGCERPTATRSRDATNAKSLHRRATEVKRDRIVDAWEAYRNNKYSSVLNILKSVNPQQTRTVDAPLLLALSHYQLDNYQQSHRYWNQVIPRLNNAQQLENARSYRKRTAGLSGLNLTTYTYNNFQILVPESLSKRVANDINHQLERAYQRIGGDFGYFPDTRTSVLVYQPGPYRRIIDAPIWSGGLFDGKIHLKYDASQSNPISARTLYHEYTHAVVHALARSNVPLWFNEGLATYEEYRHSTQEFQYVRLPKQRPRETIQSLDEINTMFRSQSSQGSKVRLGYEYSYALVQFMEERYGLRTIRTILEQTGKTSSFEKALLQTIHKNPNRLQFAWENWVSTEF